MSRIPYPRATLTVSLDDHVYDWFAKYAAENQRTPEQQLEYLIVLLNAKKKVEGAS